MGLLYLWSAETIRKGASGGLEGALGTSVPRFVTMWLLSIEISVGASAILLLSSLPRVAKGPVPAVLTVTSAVSSYYYGTTVYSLRSGA